MGRLVAGGILPQLGLRESRLFTLVLTCIMEYLRNNILPSLNNYPEA